MKSKKLMYLLKNGSLKFSILSFIEKDNGNMMMRRRQKDRT